MGIKEEKLPIRRMLGYNGQLRPLQTLVGKCLECHGDVWAELEPSSIQFQTTYYIHHGCKDRSNHVDSKANGKGTDSSVPVANSKRGKNTIARHRARSRS